MFFKKKSKIVKLVDFSIQEVSTGQVTSMLKHLTETKSRGFNYIKVEYGKSRHGDTRCYLTIEHPDGVVIQWFRDRNPSQIEELAKSF